MVHKELVQHTGAFAKEDVLQDYRLLAISRQASLIGRREVLSGKAKFGIFGDGKELAQIALAKVFRKGDWRSGYYRDQTMLFALGILSVQEFFAQLYAHPEIEADPATAGRAMNAHFATRYLDSAGSWQIQTEMYNIAADVSPTASQMPRLVGLAYASRLYRALNDLHVFDEFSHLGEEIAFGTIGNASCAEGMFWESVNAIGVLKSPAVISIWDDQYGISVSSEYQVAKGNLSELLCGFQRQPGSSEGFEIFTVPGWDYPALLQAYRQAAELARREHIPSIVHVTELTQPQGHSTSGSHERYKTPERLAWEEEFDCQRKFRLWIVDEGIAEAADLDAIDQQARQQVEEERKAAWTAFIRPLQQEAQQAAALITQAAETEVVKTPYLAIKDRLEGMQPPLRRDILGAVREALTLLRTQDTPARQALMEWKQARELENQERYSSHLYRGAALQVPVVPPVYSDQSPVVMGYEVVNACFEAALAREPRLIAFGEDVGKLGDVNQGFRGLQGKFGELRVSDTGIREATIAGQAIGMAMRGLRPIAEIQYLDYLPYALQILSDDLASLHWRTRGGQKAPVIIRTRGHRLEGIWHSGSPMAGIIHLLRGMYVLVPRDMTQAAGFYNTLLQADEPAVVVEVLNGYRNKERLPENIGEFTVPLGVPEVIRPGSDITIVTYGACCRIVKEAAEQLSKVGIEAEVIDVQTLLPFDLPGVILESLKKTSRVLFVDEDVPGGTTAYMMQEVLEKQGGYSWLDSPPRSLPGKPHRPAYGSDGDYFSKPSVDTVFSTVYEIMHEVDPAAYPQFLL